MVACVVDADGVAVDSVGAVEFVGAFVVVAFAVRDSRLP